MRANLRFVRFSAGVSSFRGGFFFRLAGFLYRWLVSLKPGILVQDRSRWIADAFLVGDALVGRLPDIGIAQEADPLTLTSTTMTFLSQGVFFRPL